MVTKYHFCPQKLKKRNSKVAEKYSFFSPIAAKTGQKEEFMFQNVAYRPTVYRTGYITIPHNSKVLLVLYFR